MCRCPSRAFAVALTGASRDPIKQKPVRRRTRYGLPAYESGAESDRETVLWLEYGTQPHLIRSQTGYLAFMVGGRLIIRKEVHHPGTQGQQAPTVEAGHRYLTCRWLSWFGYWLVRPSAISVGSLK